MLLLKNCTFVLERKKLHLIPEPVVLLESKYLLVLETLHVQKNSAATKLALYKTSNSQRIRDFPWSSSSKQEIRRCDRLNKQPSFAVFVVCELQNVDQEY